MRAILVTTAAVALLAPAAAHASGGGLTASFGGDQLKSLKGDYGYVAVPSHHHTVIQRMNGGSVDRWRDLRGQFGVPVAAYDGTRTGLSADASTLVLAEIPRTYPIRRTRLLVLDAHRLTVEQRITLRGFYAVDAVSPEGRYVYLVHYVKPMTQPDAYEVVAYDRRDGGQRVIMDPDEPGERMAGSPISRVTSADGRLEFTLYANPEEPFVHMLDAAHRSAECIDLPQLKGYDLSSTKLILDGGTVAIGDLAKLDPETQQVTLTPREPVATDTPRPRATATPAQPARDDASAWPLVALGLAAIGAVALIVARRRRSVHEVVDLEVSVRARDEEPALRE